eukprot:m.24088 g.24088  ORF g.24088 m.24088 type:complete len:57 (-) comp4222_c0_seq1:1553-1723(-)
MKIVFTSARVVSSDAPITPQEGLGKSWKSCGLPILPEPFRSRSHPKIVQLSCSPQM